MKKCIVYGLITREDFVCDMSVMCLLIISTLCSIYYRILIVLYVDGEESAWSFPYECIVVYESFIQKKLPTKLITKRISSYQMIFLYFCTVIYCKYCNKINDWKYSKSFPKAVHFPSINKK